MTDAQQFQSQASAPQTVMGAAVPVGYPVNALSSDFASRLSHWIHRHQHATQSGLGYFNYHVVRGFISGVPYAVSMAGTLGAMEGLHRIGNNLSNAAHAGAAKKFFGSKLAKFFAKENPAVRASFMIATSFTLYRGTGKLVKWAHDSLFDDKDTEAQTAAKIRALPHDAIKKIKDIAPAEAASTPVAAFVLGFVTNVFKKNTSILHDSHGKSLDWTHVNFKATEGLGEKVKLLGKVIGHPNAQFAQQAAINVLGYSLFFEMGDRLFKDRQIQRGKWTGEDNSIKPVKTPTQPDAPKEQPKKHYGFFTNEPSVGRFIFRRLAPTAISITAYTALKFRQSYMVFGDLITEKSKKILPQIPKLSAIELGAVMFFSIIPYVAEKWEKAYDSFFEKREQKAALADVARHTPLPSVPEITLSSAAPVLSEPMPQVMQVQMQGKAAVPQEIQQSIV